MNREQWLPGLGPVKSLTVTGEIVGVVYFHPDSLFGVVRVELAPPLPGYPPLIVATGTLGQVYPGERVTLTGEWGHHPEFGVQLVVKSAEVSPPADLAAVERYLGSRVVPGIGKRMASRLVETLGEGLRQALIDGDVERLASVRGVSRDKARLLVDQWRGSGAERRVFELLEEAGVGPALARRLREKLGGDLEKVLRNDPYRLIAEIPGVGFLRADQLARRLGLPEDHPTRAGAMVSHLLRLGEDQGHCARSLGWLVDQAQAVGGDGELIVQGVSGLKVAGRVVEEIPPPELGWGGEPLLYRRPLYEAECQLAKGLRQLISAVPPPVLRPDEAVTQAERSSGLTLGEDQRAAVVGVMRSGVAVITGGPGTGKTTLVRVLAQLLRDLPGGLALAAPTGRAARRLTEVTGVEARTLHRLLEVAPPVGFTRNKEKPLTMGAVLVDEVSMVDLPLMAALVAALPPGARLILVGDVDQLPSVGPGQVLSDIVASGVVPVFSLGRLYRQGRGSLIATNAHHIRAGQPLEIPVGEKRREADFFVLDTPVEKVAGVVVDLATRRLPTAYGLDPWRDIQVLSPGHRGEVGARALNVAIQAVLNPPPTSGQGPMSRDGVPPDIRAGDKVLQVRNNYTKELFNGDVGRVVDVSPREMRVDFDGRQLDLLPEERVDIELAYALTVHKAQGSEYPAVILPVVPAFGGLLRRSLLYTAVTRARRLMVLVGPREEVDRVVARRETSRRISLLAHRLGR